MDAAEFIRLSGKIVAMGKAGARSAVSRAYYGAFHLAQDILAEIASEPRGAGRSHVVVPQFLESANHPDAIAAARLLSDLHSDRIKVDYHLGDASVESLAFAQTNVVMAEECERLLTAFRAACQADERLRTTLREGIAKVKAIHRA